MLSGPWGFLGHRAFLQVKKAGPAPVGLGQRTSGDARWAGLLLGAGKQGPRGPRLDRALRKGLDWEERVMAE